MEKQATATRKKNGTLAKTKMTLPSAVVDANEVSKLIELKDYNAIARVGARWGAYLLEEELNDGVSEEKVGSMPEAHIFANGKLVGVALLDMKTQEDLNKCVAAVFDRESKKAKLVLLITGMWMSEMAVKNGGRASQQPDRVNAGVGTVYLAAENIVASVGKPVFSKAAAA